MEPHSAQTYRQMAQYIPKSGNKKKENKREVPSKDQKLPERQARQPSHGTDLKPWMKTRHHPQSPLVSQSPYRPKRPLNLASASLFDEQPTRPPTNNLQPFTNPSPRRDDPHSHGSNEFLLTRVRIMNKRKPQPDDDLLLHGLAKSHGPENKKHACDEKMRSRIETWLDGVEEFVPPKRTLPPQDFRSWLRTKGSSQPASSQGFSKDAPC